VERLFFMVVLFFFEKVNIPELAIRTDIWDL
jgi:hypothetical protein